MQKDTNVQTLKKTRKLRRKLKEPFNFVEKMLALAEQIKKKDAPCNLHKSTTDNNSFFNRDFIVRKIDKTSNPYSYWISKEGEDKVIDKRFLRQEIYTLNDQFDWKK